MTTRLATFALALGIAAITRPSLATPPPSKRFERDMVQRFHMRQSYDLVRAIERLVLRGKLDAAHFLAETLATGDLESPEHGPWTSRVIDLRDRAAKLARTKTVEDAARALTAIGAVCAACHAEAGNSVEHVLPKLPSITTTLPGMMQRHRWAADRLWDGFVDNDAVTWQRGLEVMANPPLDPFLVDPARRPRAKQLRLQVEAARRENAKDPTVRAARFGELLVTCAGCHVAP